MNLDFIGFLNPAVWIKAITLIAIVFYVIFTFIVFTQVKTMSQILHLSHGETTLKTISAVHIILAISLFAIAVVIL